MWRTRGRRMLLVGLIGGLLFGCAMAPSRSSYRVVVPELELVPMEIPCGVHRCMVLFKSDWERVVRELKAACLANGQTPQDCQAP